MKNLILFVSITLLSLSVSAQKADFSGSWKIDRANSELAEEFSMAPEKIEIVQDGKLITITRHVSFQEESFSYTDKITLDGKESENPGWGETIKKSTANWLDDKKMLKIINKLPMGDNGEMVVTMEYRKNGDQLELTSSANSSYGEMVEVMIFNKE